MTWGYTVEKALIWPFSEIAYQQIQTKTTQEPLEQGAQDFITKNPPWTTTPRLTRTPGGQILADVGPPLVLLHHGCGLLCGRVRDVEPRASDWRGEGKDRNERFLPPPQPPAEPADRDSWNAFYWREQATFDWWSSRVTLPDHVSVCVCASALLSPHCTTVLFDNWTTDASRVTMIYLCASCV